MAPFVLVLLNTCGPVVFALLLCVYPIVYVELRHVSLCFVRASADPINPRLQNDVCFLVVWDVVGWWLAVNVGGVGAGCAGVKFVTGPSGCRCWLIVSVVLVNWCRLLGCRWV